MPPLTTETPDMLDPIEYELEFVELLEAPRTPPQWVLPEVIPVGLTIVGGPPKSLKSTLVLALCARLAGLPPMRTCGLPEAWRPPVPRLVLYFSAEAVAGEMAHAWVKILGGAEGALRSPLFLVAHEAMAFRLDDPNGPARFARWIEALKPACVVLDPLRDFHSTKEADDGDINRLLRPLQRWARQNAAAVVIVHHTRKQFAPGKPTSQHPTLLDPEDLRGTSALWAVADGAIILTPASRQDDGKIRLLQRYKRAGMSVRMWELPQLTQRRTKVKE